MRLSSSQGGNVKNRTSGLKVRPPWVWWFAFIVIVLAGFPLAVSDPFSQQVVIMALMFGALGAAWNLVGGFLRSEEHTSELQSLMRISYAVFCLKKNKNKHD